MANVNGVMSVVVIATFIILAVTVWNNAKDIEYDEGLVMNETFLFSPPLNSVTLFYDEPGRRNLIVNQKTEYVGTKISVAEYEFEYLDGIIRVDYEFEVTERIIRQLDINPNTLEVYTKLNNSLVKAGSNFYDNKVTITTKKLIPITLLANPNEEQQLSQDDIFDNSKTSVGRAYDSVSERAENPKFALLGLFILIGIIMGSILVRIERGKTIKCRSPNETIQNFIDKARRVGMHDDEILATMVEKGIKPGHAAMMLKKK